MVYQFEDPYSGPEVRMADSLANVLWVVLLVAGLLGLFAALGMLYFTSGNRANRWADSE